MIYDERLHSDPAPDVSRRRSLCPTVAIFQSLSVRQCHSRFGTSVSQLLRYRCFCPGVYCNVCVRSVRSCPDMYCRVRFYCCSSDAAAGCARCPAGSVFVQEAPPPYPGLGGYPAPPQTNGAAGPSAAAPPVGFYTPNSGPGTAYAPPPPQPGYGVREADSREGFCD